MPFIFVTFGPLATHSSCYEPFKTYTSFNRHTNLHAKRKKFDFTENTVIENCQTELFVQPDIVQQDIVQTDIVQPDIVQPDKKSLSF